VGGPVPPVLWGCKPAAKIRTKCVVRLIMGPEIGWKKNRPKSGLNDPELIEQKLSKTLILSFGPKSHSRNVPPEIGWFFFRPESRVWGTFRPKSAARFVPPKIGRTSPQPQDLGWVFVRPNSGGAFCALDFGPNPIQPSALNISSISDVYHNSLELHFIAREQDLKLEIYDKNLVNTYDHSAAYCTLRRRGI
jgi:hypothetical protein